MDQKEKHQLLFTHLVISLHSATMQQLGKLKHPLTGAVERDLNGAQGTIDMLEMLKEKTKGNLAEDESRLLTQVLHELRLNYVDEMNKPAPAEGKEKPAEPQAGAGEKAPS